MKMKSKVADISLKCILKTIIYPSQRGLRTLMENFYYDSLEIQQNSRIRQICQEIAEIGEKTLTVLLFQK